MAAKISVLMGVYHPQQEITLLRRSVQSILAQDLRELELIVCDDGSSPETVEFFNQMERADSRVVLLREGGLYGLSSKLNAGLKIARGEWIARMDDDDYSEPSRLTCQLAYLKAHSEIAFVGCNVRLRCEGRIVGRRIFPEFPGVADFYMTQPFIHPTLLFRREALLAVGGYSEERSQTLCEDYDLLLRLYSAGYLGANLQRELFEYTIPPGAKGNRRFSHRINETVTRYQRFRELGKLPAAWPFVLKPLAVGLMPKCVLARIKKSRIERG